MSQNFRDIAQLQDYKALLAVGLPKSANPKSHIADGFAAEALFQFSQDFGLGNLFELVVQCGLEDADVKHTIAQSDRR